jgi:hypothetical protein
MSVLSLLFWSLALVAMLIGARWGALIGLIAFVFALMLGAVAVSRWSPPGHGFSPATGGRTSMGLGPRRAFSEINSETPRRWATNSDRGAASRRRVRPLPNQFPER